MTPHTKAILEKMKSSEYPELNFDFAFKLTNESERGAILIGASKVEEYLERLIISILPSDSKSYKNRLFKYPGALSSFSGKIELPYAFRIIDKRLYNSLNTLRKIRNQAAHSSDSFTIQKSKNELEEIYDFEYGFKEVTHKLAYDRLIQWKKENLKKSLEENELTEYDHEKLWNEHMPNPDEDQTIQEHLTVWKLAHGLTFLCLKIDVLIDEYLLLDNEGSIWINSKRP